MNEPTDPFNEMVVPLIRAAFEGPAEERARRLNGLIVTARAILQFFREVGPVVFSEGDRGNLLQKAAEVLAPAAREFAGRAGLADWQAEMLMLALALGLDAGNQEPQAGPLAAQGAGATTESMAELFRVAQDLKSQGLPRARLREGLLRFARERGIASARDPGLVTWAGQEQDVIGSLTASLFPAPKVEC